MTYKGRIQNGAVVLEDPINLPEGTAVKVEVVGATDQAAEVQVPTLLERLSPFVGKAEGLPSDLAQNHDHYLHGLPKK